MRFTAFMETRLNLGTRGIGDLEIQKVWEVRAGGKVQESREVQEIYRETCAECVCVCNGGAGGWASPTDNLFYLSYLGLIGFPGKTNIKTAVSFTSHVSIVIRRSVAMTDCFLFFAKYAFESQLFRCATCKSTNC